MRHSLTLAVASMAFAGAAQAGVITSGNILVERVGDGTTVLGSVATNVAVVEYARSGGAAVQTINMPGSGSNQVTDSGSATSNGYLNVYNGYVGVSGYNSAAGTASVASTNTKVGTVLDGNGATASRTLFPTGGALGTPPSPFAGNNFRSMIATGANTFYASGTSSGTPATGGVWYSDGTNFTQITTRLTPTVPALSNVRNIEIYGGQLYTSSSSGTYMGISAIGSGLATTGDQTASVMIDTGAGSSAYGFVLFDTNSDNAMDLAYIADDRTATGGGLQKWTLSGGAWSMAWSKLVNANGALSATSATGFAGLRGLTGTWDALNGAQLFATTTETSNNRIISLIDAGGAGPTSATNLASAGVNYAFRGVDTFGAVPAPGAVALVGLAGLITGRRRTA